MIDQPECQCSHCEAREEAKYQADRRFNRIFSIAEQAFQNMQSRAIETDDPEELERFCRQQLDGDFDTLMSED